MEGRARQATSGMQMKGVALASKRRRSMEVSYTTPSSHSETECCRSKLLMDIAVVHGYAFGDLKSCS
jgi:hypothetical protein